MGWVRLSNSSSHLDQDTILELRRAGEMDVLREVGLEEKLGDQFLSEHLHEDSGHAGLLRDGAVVLDGQDDRVGRGDEGTAVDGLHNTPAEGTEGGVEVGVAGCWTGLV